ncbi:hypothetical protein F5Y08DRAFT_91372 [Xylaria arbuscula]|nr:hypothetical protein F5Y08DRAFT_91372 [Xylaria arbuscula]
MATSSTTLTHFFTLLPFTKSWLGLTLSFQSLQSYRQDPLLWTLVTISSAPISSEYLFDEALLTRSLQRHLATSHFQEKERVDEFLYKALADKSAFCEILRSIRWARPHVSCANLEKNMTNDHEEVWDIIANKYFTPVSDSTISVAEDVLLKFFTLELPKGTKNLQWLRRHRETRKTLEEFWSALHRLTGIQLEFRDVRNEHEIERILEVITVTQTAEYKQAVLTEEAENLAAFGQRKGTQDRYYNTKIWGGETSTTVAKLARQKIKTRPQQSCENHNIDLDEDGKGSQIQAFDPKETPVPIQTTKRALKMIRFVFPKSLEEVTGSLQWACVVHAMSDLGFVARQAGGSAVLFEAAGQGKIVFHKPHPHTNIASIES